MTMITGTLEENLNKGGLHEEAVAHLKRAIELEAQQATAEAEAAEHERQAKRLRDEALRCRDYAQAERVQAFKAEESWKRNQDCERSLAEINEWMATADPEKVKAFKAAAREELRLMDKADAQKEARRRSREA